MRRAGIAAATFGLVAITLWWSTPPALRAPAAGPQPDHDIERWLALRESAEDQANGRVPDTGKRIRWRSPGQRTPIAVVYLHGFSATRQEIAPTAERVAEHLGANLFETRLAGHGRRSAPLAGVRAEDWLADGIEALRIGQRLGERVVVIGTSTGATLALALADQAEFAAVSELVMISPNIAPADANAEWLTRPAGPLLARLIAG
ncbi:MAG: alpha/beta fold hydrolase, partial [Woeseiaceae bacterium]|nr:alpha/beta fold hydrolase [Woeseiaceae bacterium]